MDTGNKTIQHGAYQITTDLYHPDAPYPVPLQLLSTLTKAYRKAAQNSKSAQKQLEKWAAEYPDLPQFKDILSLHYTLYGEREKSSQLNRELVQDHPNYVQARINLASEAMLVNEPGKVAGLLGPQLSLAALYPNRQVFLYGEYTAFQKFVFDYYCHQHEMNKAGEVLDDLKELARRLELEEHFEAEEHLLRMVRLEGLGEVEDHSERDTPTLPQTHEPPRLRLPQTTQLYRHGFSTLPDEVITGLLAADREQLRLDLENVIRDAIQRYDYFSERDDSFETTTFPLHALYLLQEIKAEESLPVVLELLRQPEDVLEFWLSDKLTEDMWQVIYTLGRNQLPQLAAFLKEPLNYTYARSEVSCALQQVALHHPERRAEVLDLYKDLLYFYLDHAADDTIIDPTLVAFVVGHVGEMGAKELLPEVKKAYKAGIVNRGVTSGPLEVEKLMNTPGDWKYTLQTYADKRKELGALETRYATGAEWGKENDYEGNLLPPGEDDEEYTDWEEVDKKPQGLVHTGHDTFVREEPRLGRNDPCYCGSGKKYKHCHGKS